MHLSAALYSHTKQTRIQDDQEVFILTATEVGESNKGSKLSREVFQKACGMDLIVMYVEVNLAIKSSY